MRTTCMMILTLFSFTVHAQQVLYFGTINDSKGTHQARFEVERSDTLSRITYAPYGLTPVTFEDLIDARTHITFTWPVKGCSYRCDLLNVGTSGFVAYEGKCSCGNDTLRVLMRDFTGDDAEFQGNKLLPSLEDIRIIERAEHLLNKGKNWNRNDNRVCDQGDPGQRSLFCALHQASIDMAKEYRHIRPAMKAVRNAIQGLDPQKKYTHLLQDFNNEAKDYKEIALVLKQAKDTLHKSINPKK